MKHNNLPTPPYEAPQASLLLVRVDQNFLASNKNASSRGYQELYDYDDGDDSWVLN